MTTNKINSLDPYLPLAAGDYFVTTGKSTWKPTDAGALADLLQGKNPPEFRTILAVQGAPDFERLTADQMKALAYAGPMYADLDGEIGEVIPAFKALLGKLQALGLDLEAVRLFATGGRGFHLEIPAACFLPSGLPTGGIAGLPHIFREVAHQLYVELMDMRVYSSKKGRMWRCVNVKRSNGKYKVPITADEALSMTVDLYDQVCAAPRAFPTLAPTTFAPRLGALWIAAKDKVSRVKPHRNTGGALRQRFGAALPPSIAALCRGEIPARGGWNVIALQLGTLAHEQGMTEEALVTACGGLIERHESDGSRYDTPRRREAELRRMYAYLNGNVCYAADVGGLRSILPAGLKVLDFRGLA